MVSIAAKAKHAVKRTDIFPLIVFMREPSPCLQRHLVFTRHSPNCLFPANENKKKRDGPKAYIYKKCSIDRGEEHLTLSDSEKAFGMLQFATP
jgi:hypothetical protein